MNTARAQTTLLLLGAVMAGSCDREVLAPEITTGVIRVAVSTAGQDLDPDGYELVLNHGSRVPVPINSTVSMTVRAGTHIVGLAGIAANCVVADNNPRNVTVTAEATTDVAFVATCTATATIRVTTVTTGTDLAPSGYVVRLVATVQHRSTVLESEITTNGSVTLPGLLAGQYELRLRQVAVNCDVTSPPPQTIDLASGDTIAVRFDVVCAPATRLLFVRGAAPEIFVISSNGAGATRVAAFSEDPAWSPDENRIAFTSSRNGARAIQVMHADGSNAQRLTTEVAAEYQPAWSPDGSRIAFVSERHGPAELYVMNADGTNQVRLTDNAGNDMQPAWSPDGSRIAFTSDRAGTPWIYVMNADGSEVDRIGNQAAPEENPAWSPDGTRLAFTRLSCAGSSECTPLLFIMNANGTGAAPAGDSGIQPAWSPDGRWLAYTAISCDFYYYHSGCSRAGIRMLNVSDAEVVALTTLDDSRPAWRR